MQIIAETKVKPHPAKFSNAIIKVLAAELQGYDKILDPFAGTGKICEIRSHGWNGKEIYCNELEREWAMQAEGKADYIIIGDAQKMHWALDSQFDAIVTSPVYGNRMSDHYDFRDGSKRYTYRNHLGRDLHEKNAGRMQWGLEYRDLHINVWRECWRVLRPDGKMCLNVSNHIREGEEQYVSEWHLSILEGFGFRLKKEYQVDTPRMRNGRHSSKRVKFERIYILNKPNYKETGVIRGK